MTREGKIFIFSRATSAVVVLVGFLVLVGWLFDLDVLKGVVPGWVTMNPLTAMCFILADCRVQTGNCISPYALYTE
jgi:hypothetical protein